MPRHTELPLIASLQLRLEKALSNHAHMVEAFEHLESGVVYYGLNHVSMIAQRLFQPQLQTGDQRKFSMTGHDT